MIAAKIADMQRGDNQHAQICATSQTKAADLLNVGPGVRSPVKRTRWHVGNEQKDIEGLYCRLGFSSPSIFVLTLIGPLDGWKLWLALAAGVPLGIWAVVAVIDEDRDLGRQRHIACRLRACHTRATRRGA
jgi:hypothetical protein